MAVQNLSSIALAIKAQSALGTPAIGANAFGIELLPSTGLAMAIQSIESQMIRRSRMRKRPRHGSRSVTAAYETELIVGGLDPVFEGVLGGTWDPAVAFSNVDWGNVVITGTGTIATFSAGTLITDGIRAGMMALFTNLSVTGNNSVWVPILAVTEGVMTLAPGYLIDNGSDAAWNVAIAKSLYTTTPYEDRLYTVEEILANIDGSKLGVDMRFNSLNFDCAANQMVKVGFGLGGRDLTPLTGAASPNFTDPVYVSGDSLVLLDGGLFVNGEKRVNATGFQFGLSAPVSTIPVLGSKTSPDVFLGQFAMTGNFNVVIEDMDDFEAFTDEDDISIFLHCAEKEDDPSSFTSIYIGHASFAGYSSPAGGEGGAIAQIPLYAGSDVRGAGYADTSILISSSAA